MKLPLDEATTESLRAMITYSDNAAADTIYAHTIYAQGWVTPDYMRLRSALGCSNFRSLTTGPTQITAGGMARFSTLDAQMKVHHREFALGLLGSVIGQLSWGIPEAAPKDWSVRFKGGWRTTNLGALVHQAAELRKGDGHLALAVLTDAQPSWEYGIETVRGVARRRLDERR